jgi:hypothetical protein
MPAAPSEEMLLSAAMLQVKCGAAEPPLTPRNSQRRRPKRNLTMITGGRYDHRRGCILENPDYNS